MFTLHRIRLFTGFLISPMVLPLLVFIAFMVEFGLQNYNSQTTLTAIKTIIGFNYLIALLLGIPAFLFLRAKQLDAMRYYAFAGLTLGMVLIIFLSHNFVYVFYIVFGVGGILEGVLFWAVALYQPVTQGRRSRRSRRRHRRY